MSYWDLAKEQTVSANKGVDADMSVPSGLYALEVVHIWIGIPSGQDHWVCRWSFQIVGNSPQAGKHVVKWSNMEPQYARANKHMFETTMGSLPAFDPEHGFASVTEVRDGVLNAVVKAEVEKTATKAGKPYHKILVKSGVRTGGPRDVFDPGKEQGEQAVPDFTPEDQIPF